MAKLEGKQVYWINAVKADIPEFNENFKEFAKAIGVELSFVDKAKSFLGS